MSFPQMSSNLLSAIPVVVNLSWAETEVFKICLVIYSVCACLCVYAHAHVQLFAAPWTVAHHATFHSSANRIFQGRILSYLF